ncbi:MAG: hypothetical protein DI551_03720 [Micavibrio aeruginosavorus]|uniref:Uncharacterized protein n=1 Tax=Micavibrio aeruginosavorus TaxID=349221 RepID=A0A2W5PRC9_9BACT|nr:MAG: hypothetical protein DI551_03720 [Micavibrio aeruginosavorus]
MSLSQPVNGEGNSRCQKLTFDDYLESKGITDQISPRERMEKLQTLFTKMAFCTRAISDNLQCENLEQRLNDPADRTITIGNMQTLLVENGHALDMMQSCVQAMDANPLSKVNGTSVEFARCSEILLEEQERYKQGQRTLASFIARKEKQAGLGDFTARIAGVLIQMGTFALAVEEMIAA